VSSAPAVDTRAHGESPKNAAAAQLKSGGPWAVGTQLHTPDTHVHMLALVGCGWRWVGCGWAGVTRVFFRSSFLTRWGCLFPRLMVLWCVCMICVIVQMCRVENGIGILVGGRWTAAQVDGTGDACCWCVCEDRWWCVRRSLVDGYLSKDGCVDTYDVYCVVVMCVAIDRSIFVGLPSQPVNAFFCCAACAALAPPQTNFCGQSSPPIGQIYISDPSKPVRIDLCIL
jgi:hypothetical protein